MSKPFSTFFNQNILTFPLLHGNIMYILIRSAWRNWQTHMTQNHAGNRVGSIPTGGTKIPIAFAIGIFLYIFSHLVIIFFLSMLYKINIPVNPIDTKIVVIIQTVFILKRSIAKNYAHLSILIMKIYFFT